MDPVVERPDGLHVSCAHVTIKVSVPMALMKDRVAFMAETARLAAGEAVRAAEAILRMEGAEEDQKALQPPPRAVEEVFAPPVPSGPPSKQPEYEECLACQ